MQAENEQFFLKVNDKVNDTSQPIALIVPSYLKTEAGTASRRLNSLWLVKNGTCWTFRRRWPLFGLPHPSLRHFAGKDRLHLTEHPNAMLPSFHSRHAGCIRLLRRLFLQEPLQRHWHSPPSAVPTNQGKPFS
jgi:hypothetical protein